MSSMKLALAGALALGTISTATIGFSDTAEARGFRGGPGIGRVGHVGRVGHFGAHRFGGGHRFVGGPRFGHRHLGIHRWHGRHVGVWPRWRHRVIIGTTFVGGGAIVYNSCWRTRIDVNGQYYRHNVCDGRIRYL